MAMDWRGLVAWGVAAAALAGGPDYDAFSDRDGNITTEQHGRALIEVLKDSGQLEAIYADAALRDGLLKPGPDGRLPVGNAGTIIDVGGTQIRLIGGRVIDGKVDIGTASRKGLP